MSLRDLLLRFFLLELGAGPELTDATSQQGEPQVPVRLLCSAAGAGGLLDEVVWCGSDDFWCDGLLAAVAIIRASLELREASMIRIVSERHGVSLPEPPANG